MQYYIHENGQQLGPFTTEELKARGITDETPIWREGMAQWKKAKDVPELTPLFTMPSPPPYSDNTTNMQPTEPCPENHLVISIFSTVVTFFCCGLPIGIIALIYALEVENCWKKGKYDKALSNARNAKTWSIVSIIVACSGFILILIYIFLIIGLEAFLMLL